MPLLSREHEDGQLQGVNLVVALAGEERRKGVIPVETAGGRRCEPFETGWRERVGCAL